VFSEIRGKYFKLKKTQQLLDLQSDSMPAVRRPKRGSQGFYPRKRASRIYPRIHSWPNSAEAKPLGFAGYKAGMTHAMIIDTDANSKTKGQLIRRSVTIIDCPSISVFGFRAVFGPNSFSDIHAEKISKNLSRKLSLKKIKPLDEQMKRLDGKKFSRVHLLAHTNSGFKKTPEVFELALGGPVEKQLEAAKNFLGKEIKLSEIFKPGDFIDAIAVNKGKGWEGPVKRFGVRILGRKFQQMHRQTGALGTTEPGKIRSTVPAGGQLGFQTRTEFNKKVLKITGVKEVTPAGGFLHYGNISGEALVLDGSVPGPAKRLIRLRAAMRPPKGKFAADVRSISLTSKRGA